MTTEYIIYFLIFLLLWIFFIDTYLNNKNKDKSMMLGLVQFGFMIPLEILLASISFNYAFGWLIVFMIPILSLYLLIDSIYYK